MRHPNNGFVSYVNVLDNYYSIKPTGNFLLRFFKILPILIWRTLKDAGIELLLLLIFWAVIMKMSQGRDLIVSLFEPNGLYGKERIIFTTLAVISYSVSMWIIPAFMFELQERKARKNKYPRNPFDEHLFFIHRILPLVPFWLLASAIFREHTWVFILASSAELALLYFFNHKVKSPKTRKLVVVILALLLATGILLFFNNFQKVYTGAKVLLAINLYLLSTLAFLGYHYVDNRILLEHDSGNKPGQSVYDKYGINTAAYLSIALVHIFIVWLIYWLPFQMRISPESMLLYMFSVYIFAVDLVFYFVSISRRRQLVATFAFIILAGLLFFTSWDINVTHHTMDANRDSTFQKHLSRDSFEDRYQALKEKILNHTGDEPYPIILVSGEGGGSRAGMWFSQNLINFDFETQGKFRDYIFSISTVSGSSVGLSTLFTFWEHTRNAGSIDKRWLNLPAEVYANNYVGSSIRGLLVTDLFKSFIPANWVYDRNNTLQTEEAKTTARAVLDIMEDDSYDGKSLPDSLLLLKKDLMHFFYEWKEGSFCYRENTPITLINTCRSNDGRRGIFSSIKLSDSYFNEAIDISGYLYEDFICRDNGIVRCSGRRKPISLIQACNTSELFPILSAPVYIDSLGSFVDGGYHENSGLKSTLDVHEQLKNRLRNDPGMDGRKYKIYIIYLKNGSGQKQLYQRMKSEPTLLQPLNALFSQPFEGSASYFEEKAEFIDTAMSAFIKINLDPGYILDTSQSAKAAASREKEMETEILKDLMGPVVTRPDGTKDTVLNFPLARWLSKTVIKRIQYKASQGNFSRPVTDLLARVRKVSNIRVKPTPRAYEMQQTQL